MNDKIDWEKMGKDFEEVVGINKEDVALLIEAMKKILKEDGAS